MWRRRGIQTTITKLTEIKYNLSLILFNTYVEELMEEARGENITIVRFAGIIVTLVEKEEESGGTHY